MTAPLRPDYYLHNFHLVIDTVEARYGDLLHPKERGWLSEFRALPADAQKLFVRLHTRQGPWFRTDTLRYEEIRNMALAIHELIEKRFVQDGSAATSAELKELFRRDEWADLLEESQIPFPRAARKEILVELALSGLGEEAVGSTLKKRLAPISPDHAPWMTTLLFLFFGNGEQGFTDFVLADLGLVRYESYSIDPSFRQFCARDDVDFLLEMAHHREQLESNHGDLPWLSTFTQALWSRESHPGMRQQRRFQRLLCELGQVWERAGDMARAQECYSRSLLPPSRERLARILVKQGEREAGIALAIAIAESPLTTAEEDFAVRFLARQVPKSDSAARWCRDHPAETPIPATTLLCNRITPEGPEATALGLAASQGWKGFFSENALWNSLFGLIFWETLFFPLQGAFEHPFQDAPLDLASPDFALRRIEIMERELSVMESTDTLFTSIMGRYERKFGIANRFVNWRWLTEEHLRIALQAIPRMALRAVLKEMMRSPLLFGSGFPDLFLFREWSGVWECELWEVKGPGDTLRPEQKRWLRFFNTQGLSAKVAWIREGNSL